MMLCPRSFFVVLVCGAVSLGQSASTPPAKGDAATQTQAASGGPGTSIESEMLTYYALQSDSEAVACDVARYLNGVPAAHSNASAASLCETRTGVNTSAGVVILKSNSSIPADFQLWRADMAVMSALQRRAEIYNTCKRTTAGGVLDLTVPGQMLTLAQSAIGMLATNESESHVGGNVENQAFMNGVARQLRVQGIRVLTPDTYMPFSFADADFSLSPALANLEIVLTIRACLRTKGGQQSEPAAHAVLEDIEAFLATVFGRSVIMPQEPKPLPAAYSPSHLASLLAADGLARELGVNPSDGKLPPDGVFRHILWLKALESGGAVTKTGNIFGTKIGYSGGAVGTYALFTLDGELECSGNVYDYAGSIQLKDFAKEFHHLNLDSTQQVIFLRGGCSLPLKLVR